MKEYDIITIVGPTASGKTSLACQLAYHTNSEIISGDSRQVYQSMDIGTGKDLDDYIVNNKKIPYHLIDIRKAGERYNVYEYQKDFHKVYAEIKQRGIIPILCGGTGLYIEAVLKAYSLPNVPTNNELRAKYANYTLDELKEVLTQYKTLHNTTDIENIRRAVRAIEIEEYKKDKQIDNEQHPQLNSLIIGVNIDRELRRKKISMRLNDRLNEGMIEEVENILKSGVTSDDLIYYGLEYKFITQHIIGEISRIEMISKLEIAIHQFAKRQMTWFRGMEKRGFTIHWINAELAMENKIEIIKKLL